MYKHDLERSIRTKVEKGEQRDASKAAYGGWDLCVPNSSLREFPARSVSLCCKCMADRKPG